MVVLLLRYHPVLHSFVRYSNTLPVTIPVVPSQPIRYRIWYSK